MKNPRKVALEILYNIEEKGAYINIELKKQLNTKELSSLDKRFITEIVHGVIKYKIRLDYIILKFTKVKMKKISPYVLNILRMGIYQIVFLDRVPDFSAINESVKLTKKYSGHSSGFVNAILRNVTRNEIDYPKDKAEYLSVYYSFEKWMVDKFISDYGIDKAEEIITFLNNKKNLTIRCNTLKISPENLYNKLSENGLNIKKIDMIDYAFNVKNLNDIASMQSYKDGEFYVQDASSMLSVMALSPKENDFVIDVCSAPGGKTSLIAQLMKNKGEIVAFDIYEHKLNLMNENFDRLGIDIIKTELYDAENTNEKYVNKADCVLVDAPCSGFGIISKKPDIKYSLNKEDISKLANQSYKILCSSANYVKKGGTLVFSLCTFTKEEGVLNVEKFLDENKEFELEEIKCYNEVNKGIITIFPNKDELDGFFICKLKRK